MKIIILFITLAISTNSFSAPNTDTGTEQIKLFVEKYINLIKDDDINELKNISISKGTCQYKAAKQIINKVGNAKYTIEVKPFSKDNDDYKLAVALNNAAPSVLGQPTHQVDIQWQYTDEHYTKDHKCHSVVNTSATITLAISNKHKIKEHSYCKDIKSKEKHKNIIVSNEQIQKIKKHINEQEHFSRIKTSQYIMKTYDYKYPEAKKALKLTCDSF